MQHWEQVWTFDTARFTIVGEITECQDDPADSFDDAETVAEIRAGKYAWFDARVRVLLDGETVGSDYLGACAYDDGEELFRAHARYTAELNALTAKFRRTMVTAKFYRDGDSESSARNLASAAEIRRKIGQILMILRNNAMVNPPRTYGSYGPDMVREAIADARKTLAAHRSVKLRAEA